MELHLVFANPKQYCPLALQYRKIKYLRCEKIPRKFSITEGRNSRVTSLLWSYVQVVIIETVCRVKKNWNFVPSIQGIFWYQLQSEFSEYRRIYLPSFLEHRNGGEAKRLVDLHQSVHILQIQQMLICHDNFRNYLCHWQKLFNHKFSSLRFLFY